jgi:hypothetical protein
MPRRGYVYADEELGGLMGFFHLELVSINTQLISVFVNN